MIEIRTVMNNNNSALARFQSSHQVYQEPERYTQPDTNSEGKVDIQLEIKKIIASVPQPIAYIVIGYGCFWLASKLLK